MAKILPGTRVPYKDGNDLTGEELNTDFNLSDTAINDTQDQVDAIINGDAGFAVGNALLLNGAVLSRQTDENMEDVIDPDDKVSSTEQITTYLFAVVEDLVTASVPVTGSPFPTKADLLAFPTAGLMTSNIAIVTIDESEDNNSTQYQWNGTIWVLTLVFTTSIQLATLTNDGLMSSVKFGEVVANTNNIVTIKGPGWTIETIADNKALIDVLTSDKVNKTQTVNSLPLSGNIIINMADIPNLVASLASKINTSLIGVANGVCPLGADTKVDLSFLPTGTTQYIRNFGTTSGDVPFSAVDGNYFICEENNYFSVNANETFNSKDWAIWINGAYCKVDSSDAIVSVNGKVGVVNLGINDIPGLRADLDSRALDADVLKKDGSVLLDVAYVPVNARSVTNKEYIDLIVGDNIGASLFKLLGDTPNSYVGQDGKIIRVDETNDQLVFLVPDNNSHTGILDGITLSINGTNPANIDISPGTYFIVEAIEANKPITNRISFTGLSFVAIPDIGNRQFTYIGINKSQTIIQQATQFTSLQRKSIAQIGVVSHFDFATVTSVRQDGIPTGFQPILDVIDVYGARLTKESGGSVTPNIGGNLNFDVSASKFTGFNINRDINPSDKNTKSFISMPSADFRYAWRDGAGGIVVGPLTTEIVPGMYDDGSGNPVAVPGNNNVATNQWIYMSPSTGELFVVYGQNTFANFAEADTAKRQNGDSISIPDDASRLLVLVSILSVSKAQIDLTTNPGAFSDVTTSLVGGQVIGGVTSLNDAQIVNTSLATRYNGLSNQLQINEVLDSYLTNLNGLQVIYNNATSGLVAINSQDAIDEQKIFIEEINAVGGEATYVIASSLYQVGDAIDLYLHGTLQKELEQYTFDSGTKTFTFLGFTLDIDESIRVSFTRTGAGGGVFHTQEEELDLTGSDFDLGASTRNNIFKQDDVVTLDLKVTKLVNDSGLFIINDLIGTIPLGFRPAESVISTASDSTQGITTIQIDTNGEIRILAINNGAPQYSIYISNVEYKI